MREIRLRERVISILLTTIMALSAFACGFADVFAEPENNSAETEIENEQSAEQVQTEGDGEDLNQPEAAEGNSDPALAEEETPEEESEDVMNAGLMSMQALGAEAPEFVTFDESQYRTLTNRTSAAYKLNVNLRTMLGEGNGGYAVAQGACTDGTYVYYMMASSSTQKGRVLKVNLSDHSVVAKGPVIGVHHANGMTYDSKRDRLVAVGYGSWRNQLSIVDPVSLNLVSNKTVNYPYNIQGVTSSSKQNGLAAISYVEKYDVFVARSRGRNNGVGDSSFNNDLWVINAEDFNVIGHITTIVSSKYPNTYQAMDADEKYVYYLLSPGSGQSKNIILALDWNSEHLLPVVNKEKDFVEYTWKCNNNGSGQPDAVITIPIAHESEGLFHTTDEDGNSHFYVSEYHGRNKYKTVTKKKAYKVKWKKVKKKVKWKKVKKKGKWKWKYKKKKVWKYKKKYKKVKVKVKDYWARDDYVYDLGII